MLTTNKSTIPPADSLFQKDQIVRAHFDEKLKRSSLCIWTYLVNRDWPDEKGHRKFKVWVSQEEIATDLHMHVNTVIKGIKQLAKGYLTIEKGREIGHPYDHNVYLISKMLPELSFEILENGINSSVPDLQTGYTPGSKPGTLQGKSGYTPGSKVGTPECMLNTVREIQKENTVRKNSKQNLGPKGPNGSKSDPSNSSETETQITNAKLEDSISVEQQNNSTNSSLVEERANFWKQQIEEDAAKHPEASSVADQVPPDSLTADSDETTVKKRLYHELIKKCDIGLMKDPHNQELILQKERYCVCLMNLDPSWQQQKSNW